LYRDTTNTMLFRVTRLSCASLAVAYVGCGGVFSFVAVNAHRCDGIVSPLSCSVGFRNPAFCIPIRMLASPPLIPGKSRMRKRACTDLCGGRSAMVVPTATGIQIVTCGSVPRNRLAGSDFRAWHRFWADDAQLGNDPLARLTGTWPGTNPS
jgi:hypothetical protein